MIALADQRRVAHVARECLTGSEEESPRVEERHDSVGYMSPSTPGVRHEADHYYPGTY